MQEFKENSVVNEDLVGVVKELSKSKSLAGRTQRRDSKASNRKNDLKANQLISIGHQKNQLKGVIVLDELKKKLVNQSSSSVPKAANIRDFLTLK